MEYIDRCYRMTNLYFSALVMISPAIAVVAEAGRTTNPAYVAHIHLVMTGMICDTGNKLHCSKTFLKHNIVDLKRRVETVLKIAVITEDNNMKQAEAAVSH
jgi:hypothetical protein